MIQIPLWVVVVVPLICFLCGIFFTIWVYSKGGCPEEFFEDEEELPEVYLRKNDGGVD